MGKPLPKITDENRIMWSETKNERLMLQICPSCSHIQYYPRFFCTNCYRENIEWFKSEGTGTIYSFTVIRRAPSQGFAGEVPYVLALIELDEGVRMMSTVLDDPNTVKIGDRVKVTFKETESDEIRLPYFLKI